MVKIKKAEYILSAAWKSQWPKESFPEMCLAGRSNVGKSSFINAMLSRNGLAKVSSTPGKYCISAEDRQEENAEVCKD